MEPQKKEVTKKGWYADTNLDVAIKICGADLNPHETGSQEGIAWIKVNGIMIVACYISPNVQYEVFSNYLLKLQMLLNAHKTSKIVLGDFNAHSPLWGGTRTDKRGDALSELIHQEHMTVLNDGKVPTWECKNRFSFIDVSAVTDSFRAQVKKWRVREDIESMSDHPYLTFEIDLMQQTSNNTKLSPSHPWRLSRKNKDRLSKKLKQLAKKLEKDKDSAANKWSQLQSLVEEACRSTLEFKLGERSGKTTVQAMQKVYAKWRIEQTRGHTAKEESLRTESP
ncbi:uncharacterized protein [Atheta coriaria]|uniref:uncharacterized protein n=1 Tax=Dalotia coriaria TaxID=877792 RepID=UPI0031F3C284